jgi:hypothetical protein
MIAFLMFTCFFSVVSLIMQLQVDEGDDSYPNVAFPLRIFFTILRTSIGDVQIYKYDNWL